MSSFFLKGKPKNTGKRKGENIRRPKSIKTAKTPNLENGQESSGSELEFNKFSDVDDSDSDHETAEQKKLRLAKKYLEEIQKEEAKRADLKEDDDAVEKRLKKDYLEQQGKLRVQVADTYSTPAAGDVVLVRAKEHRLPLTCVCISNDGQFLFTGSKCSSIVKWSLTEKKKLLCITHKSNSSIKGALMSLALTTDSKYLATSDQSSDIHIWDPANLKHIHTFKGHKDTVTGLVFRKETHTLYSASKDRSVKTWSLDEMAYVETLFGHQAPVMAIDALKRERAVTAGGRDNTLRIWKIVEESQLIFNGPQGSIDEVKLLDEEHFVSGDDNGNLCVWSVLKKKPLSSFPEAHGSEDGVPRWITSLAALLNSDVFASGSYDGHIRLWKVSEAYRKIQPIVSIEVNGFVNSLQFAPGGKHLYAALGQEHKAGRWWKMKDAKNGLLLVNFNIVDNVR